MLWEDFQKFKVEFIFTIINNSFLSLLTTVTFHSDLTAFVCYERDGQGSSKITEEFFSFAFFTD